LVVSPPLPSSGTTTPLRERRKLKAAPILDLLIKIELK